MSTEEDHGNNSTFEEISHSLPTESDLHTRGQITVNTRKLNYKRGKVSCHSGTNISDCIKYRICGHTFEQGYDGNDTRADLQRLKMEMVRELETHNGSLKRALGNLTLWDRILQAHATATGYDQSVKHLDICTVDRNDNWWKRFPDHGDEETFRKQKAKFAAGLKASMPDDTNLSEISLPNTQAQGQESDFFGVMASLATSGKSAE